MSVKLNVIHHSFRIVGDQAPPLLLAFDGGQTAGFAICERGWLVGCGVFDADKYRRNPFHARMAWGCTHIVLELPQIYRAKKTKARPEDQIKLAYQVGRLRERYGRLLGAPSDSEEEPHLALLTPREWKGQASKPMDHNKTIAKILPEEVGVFPVPLEELAERARTAARMGGPYESKWLNMLDAIGIAFRVLGR